MTTPPQENPHFSPERAAQNVRQFCSAHDLTLASTRRDFLRVATASLTTPVWMRVGRAGSNNIESVEKLDADDVDRQLSELNTQLVTKGPSPFIATQARTLQGKMDTQWLEHGDYEALRFAIRFSELRTKTGTASHKELQALAKRIVRYWKAQRQDDEFAFALLTYATAMRLASAKAWDPAFREALSWFQAARNIFALLYFRRSYDDPAIAAGFQQAQLYILRLAMKSHGDGFESRAWIEKERTELSDLTTHFGLPALHIETHRELAGYWLDFDNYQEAYGHLLAVDEETTKLQSYPRWARLAELTPALIVAFSTNGRLGDPTGLVKEAAEIYLTCPTQYGGYKNLQGWASHSMEAKTLPPPNGFNAVLILLERIRSGLES